MKKFEYATMAIEQKAASFGKINIEELSSRLNGAGQDGWELVETNIAGKGIGDLICIFKREVKEAKEKNQRSQVSESAMAAAAARNIKF